MNQHTFEGAAVVEAYAEETKLQPPEQTIFNLLKDRLPTMRMLDIGVGAGRTTLYFAKLVQEYVGVDYSAQMIQACRNRFADYPTSVSFDVCNAVDMPLFPNGSFDFVLFSFNGIDCVSHADRLRVFAEIKRVAKPGGYFCFSTHNIQSVDRLFGLRYQFSTTPKKTIRKLLSWYTLRFVHNQRINTRILTRSPFAILNDGIHDYGLQMYYINPSFQLEQLQTYFTNIKVYSLGGSEIPESYLAEAHDPWLYFLCNVNA